MSSLFNPYALTALGKPLQQRQSPELRVETPYITRAQLDMAQQTFVRFLDQARLSRVPNPTQQGRLADGTPYRIVTASGAPIMQVWPVEIVSDKPLNNIYGGFVFKSNGVNYIVDVETTDKWYNHQQEWGIKQVKNIDENNVWRIENVHNFVIDAPTWYGYLYRGYGPGENIFHHEIRICAKGEMYFYINTDNSSGLASGVMGFYSDEHGHYASLIGSGGLYANREYNITGGNVEIYGEPRLDNPPSAVKEWPPVMKNIGLGEHSRPDNIFSRDGKKIILGEILTEAPRARTVHKRTDKFNNKEYIVFAKNKKIIYPSYGIRNSIDYTTDEDANIPPYREYVKSLYYLDRAEVTNKIKSFVGSFTTTPEENYCDDGFQLRRNTYTSWYVSRTVSGYMPLIPVKYSEEGIKNSAKIVVTAGSGKDGNGGTYTENRDLHREFEATYQSHETEYRSYGFDFSEKELDCKLEIEVNYQLVGSIKHSKSSHFVGKSKQGGSVSAEYPPLWYPIAHGVFSSVPGGSILNRLNLYDSKFHGAVSGSTSLYTETTSKETFTRKSYFVMNDLRMVVNDSKVTSEVEVLNEGTVDYRGRTGESGIFSTLRVESSRMFRSILHYDQCNDLVVYAEYTITHDYSCSAFTTTDSGTSKAHPLPNKLDIAVSDVNLVFLQRGRIAMERKFPVADSDINTSSFTNHSHSFASMYDADNSYVFSHPRCREAKTASDELVDGTLKVISTPCEFLSSVYVQYVAECKANFIKSPSTGASLLRIKIKGDDINVFVSKKGVYITDSVLDGFGLTMDDFTGWTI